MAQLEREVLGYEGFSCVMYSLPWCSRCRTFRPDFEALARDNAGSTRFYEVDVSKVREAIRPHKIWAVPAVVIYAGGEEVDRVVHPGGRRQVEKILREVLSGEAGLQR